jgi:hypothetical protein
MMSCQVIIIVELGHYVHYKTNQPHQKLSIWLYAASAPPGVERQALLLTMASFKLINIAPGVGAAAARSPVWFPTHETVSSSGPRSLEPPPSQEQN